PGAHPPPAALLQHRRRARSRARAARAAARGRGGDRLTHHRRRLVAWVVLIAAIASLSYGARLTQGGGLSNDFLFRSSTAIGTFVLDGVLLLAAILIARGLPLRDAFALRRAASWPQALRIGGVALGAIWFTSFLLELSFGHASREQAVPQYWDQARVGVFAINA